MRNGTIFPNKLISGRISKICVITGLCCYIVLLGVIELTHDHAEHSPDHTEHSDSENACTTCFFHSHHVGVEIESSALISPLLFNTTLPFYEAVFLPLRLTTNTQSRAPPVFSNKLTNFAA